MTIRELAVLCVLAGAQTVLAQSFTTLSDFDGTDGISPEAAFVQGANGYLYGTTYSGGEHSAGTVFKMTSSGTVTTLYSFTGAGSGVGDGSGPYAAPILATNGNFYGTTPYAGASDFYGTVYEITPAGKLTTLYSFCASGPPCTDGEYPFAGLVQGVNGSLYGTTSGGGAASSNCPEGCGTVFTITPAGKLTTLHSFVKTDGWYPNGLVLGADGNLYGTTYQGGTGNNNAGTVFKMTPTGTLTTIHNFAGYPNDGAEPYSGLVQASDGDFYGTTWSGGANLIGGGTVYQITRAGTVILLHSFACGDDGCNPGAAPIQATDGNLYSTTNSGGANCVPQGGCGTIFEITTGGSLTTLYNFCPANDRPSCSDGYGPTSGLFQDANGTFYGTIPSGGNSQGYGTAFSLSNGLGPFVETVPVLGKVGEPVVILGTDLTGATSVTFNGTAATFTVSAPSAIKTTVPPGATTGRVKVVTPIGTLESNVAFEVK